jgi:hypothetical protein
VPSPLPPGFDVRGVPCSIGIVFVDDVAWSAAEAGDWDDWVEDCDGMLDGGSGGGVAVLDSAAGLGLTRLREPISQIERENMRGVVQLIGVAQSCSQRNLGRVEVIVGVVASRCVVCPNCWRLSPGWLELGSRGCTSSGHWVVSGTTLGADRCGRYISERRP